ncbi:MAG: hypothetical protein IJ806_08100 [Ruminococcus sp.]|nr:hypothetical protein [Ruminococcus sp.]
MAAVLAAAVAAAALAVCAAVLLTGKSKRDPRSLVVIPFVSEKDLKRCLSECFWEELFRREGRRDTVILCRPEDVGKARLAAKGYEGVRVMPPGELGELILNSAAGQAKNGDRNERIRKDTGSGRFADL